MRAARLIDHDKPLQVQEVELPEPTGDDVLVAMDYAGVNPIDRYNAVGRVGTAVALPRTLGVEGAGTTPDGIRVLVNGEGLGFSRDGTWAGAVLAPAESIVPIPEGLSATVAASIGVAGLTAWSVVALRAQVSEADTVLVMGAGGGVGLAIVSLAASRGARVIGQVGTASKADAVRAAGAESVVVGDAGTLAATGLTPTVVADPLGADFTSTAIELIGEGGRYVVFGTSAGADVTLDWQQVYRKGLTVHGQANAMFTTAERRQHLADAMNAAVAGNLVLPVDQVIALELVNDAFVALVDRSVVGKVVLDLTAAR